ncbi:hypothetical protein Q3G72_019311 [Acer saccharum]|nr:hypothetical protein Q3G72_019311 [Acer saccharum]
MVEVSLAYQNSFNCEIVLVADLSCLPANQKQSYEERTEDMELLCIILWRVLFRRNGKVHESVVVEEGDLVPWASRRHPSWRISSGRVA